MSVDSQPLGRAELSHKRPANLDTFYYGAPYYPEHWDAATRRADAERMVAAGFNIVRLAEFAWDRLEPREGEFCFDFFDEVIATLGAQGIASFLCTPTAAPPRWLTKAYPGTLRINGDGITMQHGSRQHCCYANETFRAYSRKITQAMADHYKDNPHVIGWQTDNEFNCHFSECHCQACQMAFREFLRRKFNDDIQMLNDAWGTAFWALTFDQFEDIQTPKTHRPAYPNPAHVLDYDRFLSAAVTELQHEQVQILRAAQSRWWITHNGCFGHTDYRGLFTQDLDFLGYDCYPFFAPPQGRSARQAYNLDRARAWSGNFIIPEQQSGPGGQAPYMHETPEPGEIRRMVYISVAHGADSLLHFRWRTCRFGAEEYWCGILDHDNVPRRRYDEVAQIGKELKVVGPEVLGTHVHVEAAVATSDMHVNDAHQTYPLGLPSHEQIADQVHQVLYERKCAVGCVHPADDLSDLKLYVIPHWALFAPAWMPSLTAFVEKGGTLIVGARTATRDVNNNVVGDVLPGVLRKFARVMVEEYGRRTVPAARPLSISLGETTVEVEHWYEWLTPEEGTVTLGKWQGRHLTGKPAITFRKVGQGQVVYVGTYLTRVVFAALLDELHKVMNLDALWPGLPASVSVTQRRGKGKKLWFFINESDEPQTLPRVPTGENLLTEEEVSGELSLPAHGVAVIKQA